MTQQGCPPGAWVGVEVEVIPAVGEAGVDVLAGVVVGVAEGD